MRLFQEVPHGSEHPRGPGSRWVRAPSLPCSCSLAADRSLSFARHRFMTIRDHRTLAKRRAFGPSASGPPGSTASAGASDTRAAKQKHATTSTTRKASTTSEEKANGARPAFDPNPRPASTAAGHRPNDERRERGVGRGMNSRALRERFRGGAREVEDGQLLRLLGLSRGRSGMVDPVPHLHDPEAVRDGDGMSALDLLEGETAEESRRGGFGPASAPPRKDVGHGGSARGSVGHAGASRFMDDASSVSFPGDNAAESSLCFEQVATRTASGLHVREHLGRKYAPTTTTYSTRAGGNTGGGQSGSDGRGVLTSTASDRVTLSRNAAALARAARNPKVVLCPHLYADSRGGCGGGVLPALLRTVHFGEGCEYTSSLYCGACEARLEAKRAETLEACHTCGAVMPRRELVEMNLGTGAATLRVSFCTPCLGPKATASAERMSTVAKTCSEPSGGRPGSRAYTVDSDLSDREGACHGRFTHGRSSNRSKSPNAVGCGAAKISSGTLDGYDAYDLLRDDWGGTPAKTEWDRDYTSPLRREVVGSPRYIARERTDLAVDCSQIRSLTLSNLTDERRENGEKAEVAQEDAENVEAFSIETTRMLNERKKKRMALLEAQISYSKKISARGDSSARSTLSTKSAVQERRTKPGKYDITIDHETTYSDQNGGAAAARNEHKAIRGGMNISDGYTMHTGDAARVDAINRDAGSGEDAEERLTRGAQLDIELLADIDRLISLSSGSASTAAAAADMTSPWDASSLGVRSESLTPTRQSVFHAGLQPKEALFSPHDSQSPSRSRQLGPSQCAPESPYMELSPSPTSLCKAAGLPGRLAGSGVVGTVGGCLLPEDQDGYSDLAHSDDDSPGISPPRESCRLDD